ncbi:MAG: tRNA uridine-5-carboxymethylaminomethyl(34) synthesis GTPase MnmE [Lacunisphaera sp.]|nr:tRNA uridine-5-carboxymethylaminomethyl(34) synthesis GTPase MnmE [Lacunisphaera sp.]
MSIPSDTIVALGTPFGTSAIAVVRASGPLAAELVRKIFGGSSQPRTIRRADYRDARGLVVDDVLFTYFAAPNSFTGEAMLEISCHGNPFIAQKILEDLVGRGCRPAEAGEFSKRAFLNGRLDLSQAEAVMDLIHARSEQALAAANQQLRGALGRQMNILISQLVKVLSHIEAYIDFPDEDLPPEDRLVVVRELEGLQASTSRLLATSHYGELLRAGIKTVILGEPNAGKSSLLNRLVGRERALVSSEPGTTRDYLEEYVIFGPYFFRFVDTAGLNPAPGPLEKRSMEMTLEQADNADIYLWVIDSTCPLPSLPLALAPRMTPANTIAVFNKIDLPSAKRGPLPQAFPDVSISALNGAGLEALQATVTKLAESFQVKIGEEIIAINTRHAHSLEQARVCLASAKDNLEQNDFSELVASNLRAALDAYGQIAGKIDNEQVLDKLFASFCIGK